MSDNGDERQAVGAHRKASGKMSAELCDALGKIDRSLGQLEGFLWTSLGFLILIIAAAFVICMKTGITGKQGR
jgi:hypothetical protein